MTLLSFEVQDLVPEKFGHVDTEELLKRLHKVALSSVESSLSEREAWIAFSGGVDSSILTRLALLTKSDVKISLVTIGTEKSKDILSFKGMSWNSKEIPALVCKLTEDEITNSLVRVASRFPELSLAHLEDCVAFDLVASKMKEARGGRTDLLLSANGPDELFCGYDRFRRLVERSGYSEIKNEMISALGMAYDLQMKIEELLGGIGIRLASPFLNEQFVKFSLNEIPPELKISMGNDNLRKRIWRAYGRQIGLDNEIVLKPKKAMQYSSGIHQVVLSTMKKKKEKGKGDAIQS
jgi:asparagine synthase (glutamine-hydrolysing)